MVALAAYTNKVHGESFILAGVLENGREITYQGKYERAIVNVTLRAYHISDFR